MLIIEYSHLFNCNFKNSINGRQWASRLMAAKKAFKQMLIKHQLSSQVFLYNIINNWIQNVC